MRKLSESCMRIAYISILKNGYKPKIINGNFCLISPHNGRIYTNDVYCFRDTNSEWDDSVSSVILI